MDNNKKSNIVFYISLAICAAIAIWAVAFNAGFSAVSNAVLAFLTNNFGWLYLIANLSFVIFGLFIGLGKFGSIRLVPDDSRPEYNTLSWFGMLFGCGMGVGLVFWGISEPISHFVSPAAGIEPGTAEAAAFSIRTSYMHWGVHAWGCYVIIGLAIAYFQFRKNRPGMISCALEPLIGEKRAAGWLGKLVDILAVFATVAGVVTSLGLGVMQINSGLNTLFGLPSNLLVQIIIIIIISVIYFGTAVAGIEKGIKVIGDINLYLVFIVMIACFLVGPKVDIMNNIVGGVGNYINNFFSDSLLISGYGDNSWALGWRVFYWAWWIAWAPFVGLFVARISKGRTIREFILGVLLVPCLLSIVWFGIFGSMGLTLGMNGTFTLDALKEFAAAPEVALYMVLQKYPLGSIISVVITVLLCTFFITSANSGTFVLSQLSSHGSLNPPKSRMFFWGIVQSVMAVGMLIAGGLKPLQTVSIAAAFPFIFIMFACMASICIALNREADEKKTKSGK